MLDGPANTRPTAQAESARTVIAEQRGEFAFLSMVTSDSSTAQCFFDASDLTLVQGSTDGFHTPSSTVSGAGAGDTYRRPLTIKS